MPALILYASFFSISQSLYADPWCMYEYNGVSYNGTANTTGNGSECLEWADPAIPNDTLQRFTDGNTGHNYCRNPLVQGGHAAKPWCFVSTPAGVVSQYCDGIQLCDCPRGYYGPGCRNICRCREEECDNVTGNCASGCAVGWTGMDCQKRCPKNYFGFNCAERCYNCFNSRCDPETGRCLDGCDPGFKGDNCSEKCPSGQYGRNCDGQCGNCSNSEPCHVITGHCFAGCAAGHVGGRCQQWCNETDTYGLVCVRRCDNCSMETKCDTTRGKCLPRKYVNDIPVSKAVKKMLTRKYLIIAIAGSCAVAVVITIVGCFVLKRMRDASISQHEKDVLHEFYLENYKRMESLDMPDEQQVSKPVEIYTLVEVRGGAETSV